MHRWNWTPIALVAAGVAVVWITALVHAQQLRWWLVPIFLGSLATLAVIFWLRRQVSATEQELEEARNTMARERAVLDEERRELDAERQVFAKHIEGQFERIDRREQKLSERFVAFHEWLEYPQPVDLHSTHRADQVTDAEMAELGRKDREVSKLLQAETKRVFENILNNRYAPDGTFDVSVLREDALELIMRVARIYNPNAEEPLLETSVAHVIRGASRASLHFLSQLDELPLNVKDYNIKSLYGYIRQAANAYKTYKSAEPYFPYANAAWYIGRLAMGANPISLGAWWFVGSLGKSSAQAVANHLVNRQALGLLGNLVRVVGYEVAGLYSGDFRRRDANWIYAAELTHLVAHFPLSRDSLNHALKEVGALQLRSEYDRVFLYRCLASQKSADPARWRALAFLNGEERRAIAERLEKFCRTFVHGRTPSRLSKWQVGAEERLGIKMAGLEGAEATSLTQQREESLRSLASFLVGQKEREPQDLPALLKSLRTTQACPESDKLIAGLVENPPFFFEQPNLDPDGPIAEPFLLDLAQLQVRITPRVSDVDEVVADTAAFLRRDPKRTQALLHQAYIDLLAERLAAGAPVRKFPGAVARAALDLLPEGMHANFLYTNIVREIPREPGTKAAPQPSDTGNWWLLGIPERLILFVADPLPRVLWIGERGEVRLAQAARLLDRSATIHGGQWQGETEAKHVGLHLSGPMIPSTSFFRPLMEWQEPSDQPAL